MAPPSMHLYWIGNDPCMSQHPKRTVQPVDTALKIAVGSDIPKQNKLVSLAYVY